MYVCMYVCMYVYTYTHIYAHTHIHMHTYMYAACGRLLGVWRARSLSHGLRAVRALGRYVALAACGKAVR